MISKIFKNGNWCVFVGGFGFVISTSPETQQEAFETSSWASSSGGASSSRRNAKAWKIWKCWISTWRLMKISRNCHGFYGGSYGISRNCHDFMVVPWFIKIQTLMCWKHLPVGIWKMDHFLWGSKRLKKTDCWNICSFRKCQEWNWIKKWTEQLSEVSIENLWKALDQASFAITSALWGFSLEVTWHGKHHARNVGNHLQPV